MALGDLISTAEQDSCPVLAHGSHSAHDDASNKHIHLQRQLFAQAPLLQYLPWSAPPVSDTGRYLPSTPLLHVHYIASQQA